MEWEKGALTQATIRSLAGGKLTVRSYAKLIIPGAELVTTNKLGLTGKSYAYDYEIDTHAGDVIQIGNATYISAPDAEKPVNGNMFNIIGQPVDEHYHGILVKNGKKVLKR